MDIEALTQGRLDIGAVVSFSGLCRDEGGALAALELEHFPGMAEAELLRIATEAESRWHLAGTLAIHRFGLIRPGQTIVVVAALAAHRAAAFAAANFMMDFLKTDAPFWKREHHHALAVGSDHDRRHWVAAKDSDDDALKRWLPSP